MTEPITNARFMDNSSLKGREDAFILLEVKTAPVIASWQESLFSHEWLTADGHIKPLKDMTEKVQGRRKQVEELIDRADQKLERPVLGIGIMDNIEIGSGKDLFLCLAARGMSSIPVHIPKSHESDFRIFIR